MCPSLTDSPAVPEEDEDHSEDNDNSPYVSDKVSELHTLKNLMKKTKPFFLSGLKTYEINL